jgi:uncharacterized protein (DUF736 family)
MSNYEQKDGSGALFKNREKETDNHPDYRGSIKIGGVEYWLSAWLKESGKGTKYMSLSAQPKQERKEKPAKQPAPEFVDDADLPF